uniref:SNF8 subunit of ESCRT-II n=1 Tax=Junco hyemalis TaxID=40217 RepID=A0A8C5IXC4_JUNHY
THKPRGRSCGSATGGAGPGRGCPRPGLSRFGLSGSGFSGPAAPSRCLPQAKYKERGTVLAEDQLAQMSKQLETFRTHLQAFASKHKHEIRRSPEFRLQFQHMCAAIGAAEELGLQLWLWDGTAGTAGTAALGIPEGFWRIPKGFWGILGSSQGVPRNSQPTHALTSCANLPRPLSTCCCSSSSVISPAAGAAVSWRFYGVF